MPAQDICRENSHGEAAAAQLTDWLTYYLSHTHTRTHNLTVDLRRHFTVHTPLCMHSLFLSLTVPHSHVCFLLNFYFPQFQTGLKINIVALIQLEKTWCTNRCLSATALINAIWTTYLWQKEFIHRFWAQMTLFYLTWSLTNLFN